MTPEQIARLNCFADATSVPFLVAETAATVLFYAWIRREYGLSHWKTLLVMCGLARVRRTMKLNVLHVLVLLLPMLLVIALLHSRCGIP